MRSSTNYMLRKDDVGKSKATTRTLPSEGHTFGRKEKPDAVGVCGCKYTKNVMKLLPYQSVFLFD